MAKRDAVVEALRIARKRYADGGLPEPAAAPVADTQPSAPQPEAADFQALSSQPSQNFNPQYGSPVDFNSLAANSAPLFGPPQFDPSSRSLAGFPNIEGLRYSQLPANPNFKPVNVTAPPTFGSGLPISFDGPANMVDPFLTMQYPSSETPDTQVAPSEQQGIMGDAITPSQNTPNPDSTLRAPIIPVEATDLPPPTVAPAPQPAPMPVPTPTPATGFGDLGTQFDIMGNVTIPGVGSSQTAPTAPAAPVPVAPPPAPVEPTETPPQTPDQIFQQNDPLSNLDQSGLTPEPTAPAAPAPAPTSANPSYGQLVAPGQIAQPAPSETPAPQPVVQQPDIVQLPTIGSNIDASQIDPSLVGPTDAGQQFLESLPVQGPPSPPPTSVSDFSQLDFIPPPATPPDATPPETIPPISIQEADPDAMSDWQMLDNTESYGTIKRGGRINAHIKKALRLTDHKPKKNGGASVINAFHASPHKFDQFDWSKLGQNTQKFMAGDPHEEWAMNLAKIGPWAHEADVAPQLDGKHFTHAVELSGKQADFNSLHDLEKAVARAGGPEKFRKTMSGKGYGYIVVDDGEFGGKSYIGIRPETFSIKKDYRNNFNSGGQVKKTVELAKSIQYPLKSNSEDRKHAGYSKDGGKMQWMTPDKFLEQSQEMQMDKGDKKAIKKFRKKLKKGKELNPLALYPSGGQDGRHRATAAKELGIDKVPVITWPKKNTGGSITERALMVTSKSVNHQRGRP